MKRVSQFLTAWAAPGLAIGLVTGARWPLVNASVRGGDAVRIALALAAVGAAGGALAGAVVALASKAFGARREQSPDDGFAREVLASVSCFALALAGLALSLSTAMQVGCALAAVVVAALVRARASEVGRRPLAALVVAVGAVLWSGVTLYGVAAAPAPTYEPFRGAELGPAHRVVLVGIDGADWRRIEPLVAAGRLPALARLIGDGVHAPLSTTLPTWSPILWTTIATGTLAERHGVLDFAETPVPGLHHSLQRLRKVPLVPSYSGLRSVLRHAFERGLLQERPIGSSHRRCKAVWNVVSDLGGTAAVVNWFATWPSEALNGCMVSDRNPARAAFLVARQGADRPATRGVTYPEELLAELADLGAPDLHGDVDAILALPMFAELTAEQRTKLHDEADLLHVFELIHASDAFAAASAAHLLRTRAPDFTAVYVSGVDNVSHRFRQPGVVERYYEYADGLLAEVVEAAGPDADVIVVSDHGFEYQDPAHFAHEHGPDGVMVLCGPSFRAGATLGPKPSIADVAPTVYALLGVPLAGDLDGAPIVEAFQPAVLEPHPLVTVPSYGSYAPPEGPTAVETAAGDELQRDVMQKLKALGYVDE